MVVSDPFPQLIISFLHFSTVRKFRNMRKKIAKKSNWFSRESICLCLGLLFLSPPGAAPLRQSRCSMKAKSSSSSSTHFQPDRYALKHKKASSPWKAGPVGKEENMWFHLLTVQWKNPKNIIGVAKITTNVQFCHKITTYSHMSQKITIYTHFCCQIHNMLSAVEESAPQQSLRWCRGNMRISWPSPRRSHLLKLSEFILWKNPISTYICRVSQSVLFFGLQITSESISENEIGLCQYKHRKNCECCPVSQLIVR